MRRPSVVVPTLGRAWKRRDVLGAMVTAMVLKPGLAFGQSEAVTTIYIHPKMAVGSAHLMRSQRQLYVVTAPGRAVQYHMICDMDALAPEGDCFVTLLPGSDSIEIVDRLSDAQTGLVLAPGKNFSVSQSAFADLATRLKAPVPAVVYR